MITRTGIGTLASGGGIVAALVCLLVGLQLLLLGTEIHALLESAPGSMDTTASAWKNLIQVSGWLSLFAAGLVLVLVVSERREWRRSAADAPPGGRTGAEDLDDLSVRIFEVDAANRMVEVTGDEGKAGAGIPPIEPPDLHETVADTGPDESVSILEEIEEVIRTTTPTPPAPEKSWKSFLRRFLGH